MYTLTGLLLPCLQPQLSPTNNYTGLIDSFKSKMIKHTRKQHQQKKKKRKLPSAQAGLQRLHIPELSDVNYRVTILAVFIKQRHVWDYYLALKSIDMT